MLQCVATNGMPNMSGPFRVISSIKSRLLIRLPEEKQSDAEKKQEQPPEKEQKYAAAVGRDEGTW